MEKEEIKETKKKKDYNDYVMTPEEYQKKKKQHKTDVANKRRKNK